MADSEDAPAVPDDSSAGSDGADPASGDADPEIGGDRPETDDAGPESRRERPTTDDERPEPGPLASEVAPGRELVLVGYDAWTEPVLAELEGRDLSLTVVTTRDEVAEALRARGFDVVATRDVDEAALRDAGVETADAVLVATLDDQWNVLAVLTVMNVAPDVEVVTFAGEGRDVPKLEAAGADRVISVGEAVGELLVEVALADREVEAAVDELVGALR